MSEQRNLIIAIVLSVVVVFGWQYLVGVPKMEAERAKQAQTASAPKPVVPAPVAPRIVPRAQIVAPSATRTAILTPTLDGSINLVGARFDDLRLRNYRLTTDPQSPEIELLNPVGSEHPYYAEFGWTGAAGATAPMPAADTPWRLAEGTALSPGRDVTLVWDNGHGLVFTRHISVDDRYMFTVVDRVDNRSTGAVVLYPYALVSRHNLLKAQHYWVVHEGFVGVGGGSLKDPSYDDLGEKDESEKFDSTGGWVGITDKYWMAAVIPPQTEQFSGTFKAYESGGTKAYQADYLMGPRSIAPGASAEVTHRLFAGAKVVSIVDDYAERYNIARFDRAIDWGWFIFLTKPMFQAIEFIFRYVGNFGIAILIFTLFVKILFFPIADKSYRSMSKMKKLQPEMQRLRELFKDDRQMQQQELMKLYQKEKVSPLGGCLPMLIQIPVFFSLYKVLFVTIEMRHAPFFGWIKDLSAPDPTTVFNLFGLIPWDPPSFLMIGLFPIIMGFTMWLQTNLNPPPADPTQAKIFAFMPLIFTYMLSSFPVGLVIYWTWNNILSIVQQIVMMKRTGTPVDLFDRLRGMGKRLRRGEPLEKPAGPPD
jgi:YidC/Oxa1 family membrane protein insertase